MGWLKKIFKKVLDILKKIWDKLKIVIVVILICLAIWFSFGGVLMVGGVAIGGMWGAIVCIGAAFILFPKESAIVAGKIAAGVTSAAVSVGNALGTVVAGAAGGIVGGLFGSSTTSVASMAAIGIIAYFLLRKKEPGKRDAQQNSHEGSSVRSDQNETQVQEQEVRKSNAPSGPFIDPKTLSDRATFTPVNGLTFVAPWKK